MVRDSETTPQPPASGTIAGNRSAAEYTGREHDLLADGRLRLSVDPGLLPLIENWLPRFPIGAARAVTLGGAGADEGEDGRAGCPAAQIRIRHGTGRQCGAPAGEPTIRLGSASAWVDGVDGKAILHGTDPRVSGTIDLAGPTALLEAPSIGVAAGRAGNPGGMVAGHIVAGDLYSMLTVSAALLLGRLGRTPVHAAAVVPPGGGALLLAGDARAGKSTTSVNLIAAGWDYLSDDQVVLSRSSRDGEEGAGTGIVHAEGWPRTFHLDEGWERGVSTGNRRDFDPAGLGPGSWLRTAPVEGLLFPVVRADYPTHLSPISAADALGRLLRQTPWLLVDTACGQDLLALLTEVARYPAHELSLGLDTYQDPKRLSNRISAR